MDELLSILGFSVGATLGASVVRSIGGGWRPLLSRGFRASLAVGQVFGHAKNSLAGASSGAGGNVSDIRAEAAPERVARRNRAPTQKIEVVQE